MTEETLYKSRRAFRGGYYPRISGLIVLFCFALSLIVFSSAIDLSRLKKTGKSARFLVERPSVTVRQTGEAFIEIKTIFRMENGRLYYGSVLPESSLPLPRYRFVSTAYSKRDRSNSFSFPVDVKDLWYHTFYPENKKDQDLNVYYRLLIYDRKWKRDRVYEGNFSVRKIGGRYYRIPSLVIGPVIDDVRPGSAVISWESDLSNKWRVEIKPESKKSNSRFISPNKRINPPARRFTRYETNITGLTPGTRYSYRVIPSEIRYEATPSSYPWYSFKTAPKDMKRGKGFRFVVIGDSQAGPPRLYDTEGVNKFQLNRLALQALREQPDFIVTNGDLVTGYSDDEFDWIKQHEMYYRAVAPTAAFIPIYEIIGNHDTLLEWYMKDGKKIYRSLLSGVSSEELFSSLFVSPDKRRENRLQPERVNYKGERLKTRAPEYGATAYAFPWGNAYFVILNSSYLMADPMFEMNYGGFILPEQAKWLDKELDYARNIKKYEHIFVFRHHPMWPPTYFGNDVYYKHDRPVPLRSNRRKIWDILQKYSVTALIAGHHHHFAKYRVDSTLNPRYRNPVWQIISGSGGSTYYPRPKGTPYNMKKGLTREVHYLIFEIKGAEVKCSVMNVAGIEIESFLLN